VTAHQKTYASAQVGVALAEVCALRPVSKTVVTNTAAESAKNDQNSRVLARPEKSEYFRKGIKALCMRLKFTHVADKSNVTAFVTQ
jgi:hypothetical protein